MATLYQLTTNGQAVYKGDPCTTALHKAMQEISETCYAVYACTFGEVIIYTMDKLPSSKYAPTDYPAGYWYKGVHRPWSEARIIANQNIGGCDR